MRDVVGANKVNKGISSLSQKRKIKGRQFEFVVDH
jgi:hypothetical protein